jgi:transcriptional regulator with PAS, ATPase and Fis domain
LGKKPAVDEVRDYQDRPTLFPAREFVPILESNDPVMQRSLEKARRAAASDAMVLLTGESGTGKDVLAYQIHRWSARAEGPFIPVNCRGHSEQLLESELFGQTRGGSGGAIEEKPGRLEAAHGGSIFLDEISDLTPPLQTKLLHFIKEQSFERVGGENTIAVDARIIAASSHDLVSEVATQRFREDLYYRLGVITLQVPALRDRPGDILPLATSILAGAALRMHRPALSLSPEASSALMRYRWPGNIFELGNAIERAVVLCRGDLVLPSTCQTRSPTSIHNRARSLLCQRGSTTSNAIRLSGSWQRARRSGAPHTSSASTW